MERFRRRPLDLLRDREPDTGRFFGASLFVLFAMKITRR